MFVKKCGKPTIVCPISYINEIIYNLYENAQDSLDEDKNKDQNVHELLLPRSHPSAIINESMIILKNHISDFAMNTSISSTDSNKTSLKSPVPSMVYNLINGLIENRTYPKLDDNSNYNEW